MTSSVLGIEVEFEEPKLKPAILGKGRRQGGRPSAAQEKVKRMLMRQTLTCRCANCACVVSGPASEAIETFRTHACDAPA